MCLVHCYSAFLCAQYYTEMDPISCAKVNGSDYCWVEGNVGERFRNNMYLGAYLFPIIQHFDADCKSMDEQTKPPKKTRWREGGVGGAHSCISKGGN